MAQNPRVPSNDDQVDLAPGDGAAGDDYIAPELVEQDEEAAQAQSLADEALSGAAGEFGLSDSEKVGGGIDDVDVPDLVDHMHQMATSGRIDMSAFRGERNDDDEDGMYGDRGVEE